MNLSKIRISFGIVVLLITNNLKVVIVSSEVRMLFAIISECGGDDWGWRVRFFVFLNLSKIHTSLTNGGAALGIRTVIWKMLEKARLLERDLQVLEALKVVQVGH